LHVSKPDIIIIISSINWHTIITAFAPESPF
jgi:hypothetical protein